MMKALWLTPGYPWPGNPVGFLFHQTQARALSSVGIEVTVTAPTPWVPPGLARYKPRWTTYAGAPRRQRDGAIVVDRPRYLTTPRESRLGIAHLAQSIALARTPRPDLIHAHFAYPSGTVGIALKRRFDVPLVLTLHGDDVTVYPHHNARMRRLFVETVRGADKVLAVSPALAAMTADIAGVRPTCLPVGVDIATFAKEHDRSQARSALGLPPEAFVLLFVGALLPQKGILDLAQALHRLDWPDAVALCVGDGPARPTGTGIRLLGRRTNAEIPGLLAAADVFVLPSWHEGLGLAAVEAGAAGIPVAGAQTGGLADLLADDRGFLFAPRDPADLAEVLRQVRANPAERCRRAARLREHVRAAHDLHRNAQQLSDIYRGLGQERGP